MSASRVGQGIDAAPRPPGDASDSAQPRRPLGEFDPTQAALHARRLTTQGRCAPRRPNSLLERLGEHADQPLAGSPYDRASHPDVDNPYWRIARELPTRPNVWGWVPEPVSTFAYYPHVNLVEVYERQINQESLIARYARAIPCPAALEWMTTLLDGRPVVEIGAGTGYWAWTLTQHGVDVAAFDPHPPGPDNPYCQGGPYAPVATGDASVLREVDPERVLLLCWPRHGEPDAPQALDCYQGDLLIYCGEGADGLTGDAGFHERLDADWREIAAGPHVSWSGFHDRLVAYRRATPDSRELAGGLA